MIFAKASAVLTAAIVLFGLVLLAASIITRRQRPHPLLHKAVWLVAVGLLLAWAIGGVAFVLLLAAAACVNYALARAIGHAATSDRARAANAWLVLGILLNVAVLAVMRNVLGVGLAAPVAVVGVSYVTLHAISLLVDVRRGRMQSPRHPGEAGVYLLLLPQFVAGPVTYHAASAQLARRAVGMSDFAYGVRRLAIGIGKQLFIAAPCAAAADAILRQPAADLRAASAWAAFACFAVQIYFAFSSVADMAIGLGRLFGLRLEENFRWPYAAESLEQFWQRWHMGLAGWMREHVAAPARRYGAGPAACDALVVLLCAAWYGVTWGCLAWGLYHAALVALERSRVLNISALPRALRHGYVIGAVLIGWVLLRSATAADAALYLKALAGLHTPLHYRPLPISTMGWAALGAGIIGSAPLARQLRRWSVAIDGATTSAVMMLFATFVFVWRLLLLLLPTGTKRLRAAR